MTNFFSTIQGKIFGLILAGLIFLGSVTFYAIASMRGMIVEYQSLLERDMAMVGAVDNMNIAFKRQVQEWKNILLRGDDPSQRNKYWRQFEEQHHFVQSQGQDLLTSMASGPKKDKLSQLLDVHKGLLSEYKQGLQAYESAGYLASAGDAAVAGVDREPSRLLSELAEQLKQDVENDVLHVKQAADRTLWVVDGVWIISAILVLVLLNVAVRKFLVQPMNTTVNCIQKMAEGDFNVSVDTSLRGELGVLNSNVNKMKDDLGSMIKSIAQTSSFLVGAVGELNRASDRIGQNTANAENFSGQVAASITEMAATVNEVASNAASAAEATQQADQNANSGLSTMENAIRAIGDLASDITVISEDMIKLERDSTSVGAVLDVIKGIAEQTNLLALNAAIEAARAGEQGRGFAVVADEVRALAQRTQESTEEIQHMIETLQAGAATAVQAMQAGNSKTEQAVQLSQQAGIEIRQITEAVGRIRDMNNQIAAASEQQSVAADEISRNVVSMSELAQNANKTASETRDIASHLDRNAGQLQDVVARFKHL